MTCRECAGFFVWIVEDKNCSSFIVSTIFVFFSPNKNYFFVCYDLILQSEKRFCQTCFKKVCFVNRFIFPNVSFDEKKKMKETICV